MARSTPPQTLLQYMLVVLVLSVGMYSSILYMDSSWMMQSGMDDELLAFAPAELSRNVSTSQKDMMAIPDSAWVGPILTNETMVILVMSARSHIAQRAVIRDTWAKGHDNVYFVVGSPCEVAHDNRKHDLTCEAARDSHQNEEYEDTIAREEKQLRLEQAKHRDMLLTSRPESYRGLPYKLKEAYHWAAQLPQVEWFVKADDDFYVRVTTLAKFLQATNSSKPLVMGRIMIDAPVHKRGKWKEVDFRPRTYPKFPLGSWGHIVSRPIAGYVAEHREDLFEYQGEDTSLGIWIDKSPLKKATVWKQGGIVMTNNMMCVPQMLMIGHQMTPDDIRECYRKGDEASAEAILKLQQNLRSKVLNKKAHKRERLFRSPKRRISFETE